MEMTRLIRWIGVLALVWTVGCGQKEAQVVTPKAQIGTEVAVWVDDIGINGSEIQAEVKRLFEKLPAGITADQLPVVQMRLLQQAVDNLVVRQLVRGEMSRSGILISQEEIEKGKADLEKGLGQSQSLAMVLAAANLPMEELEMNLRLDLFKNKVLKERQLAAIDAVTDETVETYYQENPLEFTKREGRLASHILVRVSADADEATLMDRRAKAQGLRTALMEGANFETLASEVSECSSRMKGGALGVIPKGREAKEFEEAVYGQEIGAIGEVVQSPVGFHIIKVTGNQQEELISLDDDVKVKLAIALKTRARQQVVADYMTELREKATIKLDGPLAVAVEAAKVAQAEAEAAGEAPLLGEEAPATAPAAPAVP
jgi:peptidyl-prolyl cis-trans isomerase C